MGTDRAMNVVRLIPQELRLFKGHVALVQIAADVIPTRIQTLIGHMFIERNRPKNDLVLATYTGRLLEVNKDTKSVDDVIKQFQEADISKAGFLVFPQKPNEQEADYVERLQYESEYNEYFIFQQNRVPYIILGAINGKLTFFHNGEELDTSIGAKDKEDVIIDKPLTLDSPQGLIISRQFKEAREAGELPDEEFERLLGVIFVNGTNIEEDDIDEINYFFSKSPIIRIKVHKGRLYIYDAFLDSAMTHIKSPQDRATGAESDGAMIRILRPNQDLLGYDLHQNPEQDFANIPAFVELLQTLKGNGFAYKVRSNEFQIIVTLNKMFPRWNLFSKLYRQIDWLSDLTEAELHDGRHVIFGIEPNKVIWGKANTADFIREIQHLISSEGIEHINIEDRGAGVIQLTGDGITPDFYHALTMRLDNVFSTTPHTILYHGIPFMQIIVGGSLEDLREALERSRKYPILKIWARITSAPLTIRNKIRRLRENKDKAMTPGGIDLNSANLTLHIKRDGNGVPLPLAQQDLAQFSNIQGLDPVILSIKPASQTALFSQLIGSP